MELEVGCFHIDLMISRSAAGSVWGMRSRVGRLVGSRSAHSRSWEVRRECLACFRMSPAVCVSGGESGVVVCDGGWGMER